MNKQTGFPGTLLYHYNTIKPCHSNCPHNYPGLAHNTPWTGKDIPHPNVGMFPQSNPEAFPFKPEIGLWTTGMLFPPYLKNPKINERTIIFCRDNPFGGLGTWLFRIQLWQYHPCVAGVCHHSGALAPHQGKGRLISNGKANWIFACHRPQNQIQKGIFGSLS